MVVQPGVEVERVEPNQPADSHDRDAPLLNQPTDVPDARAEEFGHRVDVEQSPPVDDRSDGIEGSSGVCMGAIDRSTDPR
jgi:hypothetical protein